MPIIPATTQAFRKQTLLVALQDDPDVFETLVAANAVPAFNVQPSYEDDELVRQTVKATFGNRPFATSNRRGRLNLSFELAGSGSPSVAPPCAPLLQGGGMAETERADDAAGTIATTAIPVGNPTGAFTYAKTTAAETSQIRLVTLTCTTPGGSGTAEFTVSAPAIGTETAYSQTEVTMTDATAFALPNSAEITPTVGTAFAAGDTFQILIYPPGFYYSKSSDRANHKILSVEFNLDSQRHRFLAARGNVAGDCRVSQYGIVTVSLMGLFVDPAAAALPATDYTDWQDPEPIDFSNTKVAQINGKDVVAESFGFDLGAQLEIINRINRRSVRIGDFQPSLSMVIENPSVSELDLVGLRKAGTEVPIQFSHGTADGKIFDLMAIRSQLGQPSYQDSQGDVMASISARPLERLGDDELIIGLR